MTLSIASNASGYGKPLGYGLAGLTPIASVAEALQRSGSAAAWSYTPPSVGAGGRNASVSDLMAVLSRLSAGADATSTGVSGQRRRDGSGSTSGTGLERSDAADLLQALNDTGGAAAVPVNFSSEPSSPEPDRQPLQALAQRPAADVTPADPSISAADAQLQALFKTLQEYGL